MIFFICGVIFCYVFSIWIGVGLIKIGKKIKDHSKKGNNINLLI